MRKKKGFTLIELLVVIAIIAMLLAILMPALGKVKKLAMRLVCGTNVKGLGTAMNVYAFDYNDEFPKQGGGGQSQWGNTTSSFQNPNKNWDSANSSNWTKTVNASLYMLVREADVSPKSFICPASNDVEFKISEDPTLIANNLVNDRELVDIWDFGLESGGVNGGDCHNSYSYQQPYWVGGIGTGNRPYSPDASGNAARVVLGDKTPYGDMDLMTTTAVATALPENWVELVGKIDYTAAATHGSVQWGNSSLHDREGQNVLYNDGHAEFARRPDVSINNDNIYARKGGAATEVARRNGIKINAMFVDGWSNGSQDTVLVSDAETPAP